MPIRNTQIEWIFPDLRPVPADFQLAIGESPLVAKTLYQRGLTSPEAALAFINPDLYLPSPPSALPNLKKATIRIIQAIENKDRILIWGDFDVDGQTSTTLLLSSLKKIGALATHHIPIRAQESHGVSLPVLSKIIQEFSPDLIITCDTGVDAHQEVEYAIQRGIDFIITDHHQLPPDLPNATAIINPNMLPAEHALFNLPGVGVAYKLIEDIYTHFSLDPTSLLDLVALGIVADVAEQTGDTRFLLQQGLRVLRQTPRLGLQEIYQNNNLSPAEINEEHIGFIIGPRLNALGRLDNANSSVEFLTTDSPHQAATLAKRLEELNSIRQNLTQEIFEDALNMVEAYPELVEDYPILVLQGSPQWHPGVIGIVASRLVDQYQKPVIMLAQDGDHARGSARSIPGFPIADLISASEDLLTSHGGHPMAAGLRLPLVNVSQFRRSLAKNVAQLVGDDPPTSKLQIDLEIPFQDISESFINDFQRIAPFGAGNPKLTFATRGVYTDRSLIKTIGKSGNHRKITFSDASGDQRDFLWWNSIDHPVPDMPLDIAYSLEISTFRNQPQIQATLSHLRQSRSSPIYVATDKKIKLLDLRRVDDPRTSISEYYSPSTTLIWAENRLPPGFPSVPRSKLSTQESLVIWSSPPSKFLLSQIINRVDPKQLILVGVHPQINSLSEFIQSLLGLIKHQELSGNDFDLIRFSEALAFPEDMINVGLKWIHQKGDLDLDNIKEGQISPGPGYNLPEFSQTDKVLKHMLREVLAYRSYFINAHIRAIL